jgi:formylglycine-generating enzyme required for sulfatase activity
MWSDPTSRDENTGCRVCFFPQEDQPENPQPDPQPPRPGDLKAGQVTTNSLGMKFAWIPPGTFQMGSPPGEEDRREEETQHPVKLTRGFYLGVNEVSQGQWRAVMGNNNSSEFKGDERPVEKVSWDECQEFCRKLSEKDGKRYRLPTEAEWEYACRAGTTTPFHLGETISTDEANYDGNYTYGKGQKGRDWQQTTPVGNYSANAWGLHDMHGNVAEWCQDRYGEYQGGEETDPQGPEVGDSRVVRGGSWNDGPKLCRAAFRLGFGPSSRNDDVGFRVVLCHP